MRPRFENTLDATLAIVGAVGVCAVGGVVGYARNEQYRESHGSFSMQPVGYQMTTLAMGAGASVAVALLVVGAVRGVEKLLKYRF